jgi:hypothetical protein
MVDWKVVVEEYRLALKEGDYGRGPRGNWGGEMKEIEGSSLWT